MSMHARFRFVARRWLGRSVPTHTGLPCCRPSGNVAVSAAAIAAFHQLFRCGEVEGPIGVFFPLIPNLPGAHPHRST
jgi:hypothetical protein